jgi:hypothetical protein
MMDAPDLIEEGEHGLELADMVVDTDMVDAVSLLSSPFPWQQLTP